MAKAILMDELHVHLFAPRGLPEVEYRAMHRALHARRFLPALRRAVRGVIHAHPSLGTVRVTVTR